MKNLTKIQQKYYRWLLHTTLKNHNFPTRLETAKHFKVGLTAVNCHLMNLEKKGYIKKVKNSPKYKFTSVTFIKEAT